MKESAEKAFRYIVPPEKAEIIVDELAACRGILDCIDHELKRGQFDEESLGTMLDQASELQGRRPLFELIEDLCVFIQSNQPNPGE